MKLKATRQVLAVMAVTTALCADRVADAAPLPRPDVTEMAGRLVMRLAQRLRRVVAIVSPWQDRQRGVVSAQRSPVAPAPAFVAALPLSPFQFRLPPPTV